VDWIGLAKDRKDRSSFEYGNEPSGLMNLRVP
jgi:hypothetical protein